MSHPHPPGTQRYGAATDGVEPGSPQPKGQRVLLVDDDPLLLRTLARGLKHLGFEVTTAEDPRQAIAMLRDDAHQFDTLITDMGMPFLNGMQTASAAHSIRSNLPILLFSGMVDTEVLKLASESGISRVMSKPALASELATAIRELQALPTR